MLPIWFPCALDAPPIDPFKQHRKLRTSQRQRTVLSLGPDEPSTLKTLGEKTKPVPIGPKELYDVTSSATEDKDVPGERLLRNTCCT